MTEKQEKIKEGYKQTEIGVIPENWEVKTLEEIGANFYKGKGLAKKDIDNGGKHKCIHYGELFTVYNEKIKEIYGRTNKKGEVFLSKQNDVLMPTSDVTPNGLATASCINEPDVILGGDILIIRISPNIIDGNFFTYGIKINKKQIMSLISGTTVYHLYPSEMKNYKFTFPVLVEEQTAIANVLSDTDKLIENLEKLIDKKKKIKQGTMQQLLTGKKRLPGFSGEWEVKKLGDVFDILKGSGLSKSKIISEGKYECILYGEIFTKYNEVIYEVLSRTNSKEGVLSRIDDILLPGSTTTVGIDLARASALKSRNVLLGGDINILRYKNKINSEFIAYSLTHIYKSEIAKRAKGITVYHLHGKDLFGLKISSPKDIKEQTAIANVLSDMDKEIEILEKKLDKYKKIKVGMMQQLLTGKIRIYEPAR